MTRLARARIVTTLARALAVSLLAVACVAVSGCGAGDRPGTVDPPLRRAGLVELGVSFPSVRTGEELAFSGEKLDELGVRRVRFAENWREREPADGTFDWAPLDARVDFFAGRGIDVLLTVQSDAPDWVRAASGASNRNSVALDGANTARFRRYVERLLRRYPGKIKEMQFGNEWQSRWWYAGTAREFTETQNAFYDTVKSVDPGIRVVLGGFSIGALRALAAEQGLIDEVRDDDGARLGRAEMRQRLAQPEVRELLARTGHVLRHARYDATDIHLYDDPESWGHYLRALRSLAPAVPTVVSEFGGPNTRWEPYSPERHRRALIRYVTAIDSLDVDYALYFRLVESRTAFHEKSGLIDAELNEKPAYGTFGQLCAAGRRRS